MYSLDKKPFHVQLNFSGTIFYTVFANYEEEAMEKAKEMMYKERGSDICYCINSYEGSECHIIEK